MTEDVARFWDSTAKMITALGLVIGGLWTVWKYFDARKKEKQQERDARDKERALANERAKSAEVEARKPFSTKQLELYFQAVDAVSLLATLPKSDPRTEFLTGVFWGLYWGPLALVEDQKVASAMVNFGQCLNDGQGQQYLQIYALELARACRDSIAESWKVSLPEIERSQIEQTAK